MWFMSSGTEVLGQTATDTDAVSPELRDLVPAKVYQSRLSRMNDAASAYLDAEMMSAVAASPCGECIATFIEAYAADEAIRDALGAVVAGLQPPPAYAKAANPWKLKCDCLWQLFLRRWSSSCFASLPQ